jgi:flagellar hook-associated protein 2
MSTNPINVTSLLQAFGLGGSSSFNVNTIVSELMQVNEQPLTTMQNAVTNDQANITAYGTILSNLSSLQSAVKAMQNSTVGLSATPSDSSYFSATATSGATVGTTAIDIKNLATAQSIYSTTFSSASSAVADLSSVGTQQLEIQVGSSAAVTVNVDSSDNTLSGIAGAINSANAGVTASVLEVSTGNYSLVLNSNATGSSNTITVKVDESGSNFGPGWSESGDNTDMAGLSKLAFDPTANGGSYNSSGVPSGGIENMTQTTAGADATLSVNGIEIQRASNTVSDAITGVTLNLLQADSSYSATSPNLSLNVAASSDALAGELNSFVSAYNTAMSTINNYYQPPPENSTSSTSSQQGLLSGDNILLTLSNTLKNVTTNPYGSESNLANNSLAYIGVTHDNSGTMQFNASQLTSAYQTDSANVTAMINNMANSFGAALNNYINTTLPSEESGYQTQVTSTQNQENYLSEQLTYEQTALTSEYSALSSLVTSDNNVSNFLTEETDFQDKQSGGA